MTLRKRWAALLLVVLVGQVLAAEPSGTPQREPRPTESRPVKCERVSDRSVFVRMESGASVRLAVTNLQPHPLPASSLLVGLQGQPIRELPVAELAPGASTVVEVPLDTRLRPGPYTLEARLVSQAPESPRVETSIPFRLVARHPPHQYPVLMWGVYGNVGREFDRLQQIGFTHVLGLGADSAKIWAAHGPTEPGKPEAVQQTKRNLDEALARGMTLVASLSPGPQLHEARFVRVDRQGKPLPREPLCGLFPEVQQYCYHVGVSMAQAYGGFPAFGASLIHSEVRDAANLCFHPLDHEAFQKAAGFDIPPQALIKAGVDYRKLSGFPATRVISDQDPLYQYYRWYWKQGDGWNELNTQVARGLKSTGRSDLWTFHDPAVRVASTYGSGGEVDVLSHWTYSYPDPIRIALATDELLAMAGGRPGQTVMKMTQLIWYRSQTAPEAKKPEEVLPYRADWELQQPDAPFITIAPLHLREAFWAKIARPIRGIMYHGWQSLVPCEPMTTYRYTNPQTQHELTRLVHEVIRPLGPTLLQVPGVKSDVAYLESFASQMFARRGTYGWCGRWSGDGYLMALWAHLQPEIVYDETIVERGLEGVRLLFMFDCDVITEAMAERIRAFQAAGGVIVGDDRLAPAIRADIRLKPFERTGRVQEDKAALLALAGQLRQQLNGLYAFPADTSNPEVIPYRRQYRDSDYLFLVNDQREFGSYVGQHGRVMEDGVPSAATISLARPAGYVYDLVEHKLLGTRQEAGRLAWNVLLGPCDGGCYLVTSRAVANVAIHGPELLERGQSAGCSIAVLDLAGQPIDAVIPVEVTIRDSSGAPAEFSGFYGAADGRLEIPLDIAPNDPPGVWSIEVRELASGRTATAYFRVRGPIPWPPASQPVTPDSADPVQPKG